ncbi:recombinase RecR [Sorangium cellulosum]|uniref:Recombination protein RecR n=1 Tax=Sorangium cellulosum TaxID=56 RepID=A0A4P2PTX7_SORCE|nr:recombination mediator RecR [Sorangium cellulosum]AUX19846.1 recombinase RecR [Sorangium cellulosum]
MTALRPPSPLPSPSNLPNAGRGAPAAAFRGAPGGLPGRLSRVAQLLARLPGVGEKTAQRFALFLVTAGEDTARDLGSELVDLCEHIRPCTRCGHIAEVGEGDEAGQALCAICRDARRDGALLCVVARVQDLLAIERSGAMRGRYFVLGRLLSPLEGVGAEELPLEALRARVRDPEQPVREVLVATPPSVDGEATALLIARELGALGIQVTRIASGVPHGGDLEFADQVTLGRAIEGRKRFG